MLVQRPAGRRLAMAIFGAILATLYVSTEHAAIWSPLGVFDASGKIQPRAWWMLGALAAASLTIVAGLRVYDRRQAARRGPARDPF